MLFRCTKILLLKSFKTKTRINVLSYKAIHKSKVQLRIVEFNKSKTIKNKYINQTGTQRRNKMII